MSAILEAIDQRTAALRAPIPGAKPWGEDVSYDSEFEKIKAEIDKIGSLEGVPNWTQVVTGAEQLLTSRSKDLRVAVWLTIGKLHTTGVEGLAEGLLVCRDIARDYWADVGP